MPSVVRKAWISFETGGHEESAAVSEAPSVGTTPSPASAKETYTATYTWKKGSKTLPQSVGSGWVTSRGYMQFTNVAPDSFSRFMTGVDDSGQCWALEMSTASGYLRLLDANDALIAAFDCGLTTGVWYRIEVKCKHADSTDVRVFVDGVQVYSGSTKDMSSGGSTYWVELYNPIDPGGGYSFTFYSSHVGWEEDDGAAIDTLNTWSHDYCAKGYQNTLQGNSGDWGSPLDPANNWSAAGNTPGNDATDARYSIAVGTTKSGGVNCNEGARPGPYGDSDLTDGGQIVGASWAWRVRNGVAGFTARVNFSGQYGHTGDASIYEDNYGLLPGDQSVVNHQHFEDVSGVCPTTSDYIRVGVKGVRGATGIAGRLDIFDIWGLVLYQEAAAGGNMGIVHRGLVPVEL